MIDKEYPHEEPTKEEQETIRREFNALKTGAHHVVRIRELESALAAEKSRVEALQQKLAEAVKALDCAGRLIGNDEIKAAWNHCLVALQSIQSPAPDAKDETKERP